LPVCSVLLLHLGNELNNQQSLAKYNNKTVLRSTHSQQKENKEKKMQAHACAHM